jgi:hypothetical protein
MNENVVKEKLHDEGEKMEWSESDEAEFEARRKKHKQTSSSTPLNKRKGLVPVRDTATSDSYYTEDYERNPK